MKANHISLYTPAHVAALWAIQGATQPCLEFVRRRCAAWRRRNRSRMTLQTLRTLDERTLRDLGIDRSELVSIAHDPLTHLPLADATAHHRRRS